MSLSKMYYILDDSKNIIPVDQLPDNFWNDMDMRRVKEDWFGRIRVSTVFLGIDHSCFMFNFDHQPVLFETMIFGLLNDSYQERACTWDEALACHQIACNEVIAYLRSIEGMATILGSKDGE